MNTDIRLAVGFWQHPKVRKLEKRLGLKGVRSLQILWCWCAQNRPSGLLAGLDAEDIELAADWRGKPGAFFEQCLDVWLVETADGYALHEWQEHNPWQAANGEKASVLSKKRSQAAQKRWRAGASDETGQPAENMQANANAMQNENLHMQNSNLHDAKPMQNENLHMQNDANACSSLTLTKTINNKNINLNTASAEPAAPPPSPAGAAELSPPVQTSKGKKPPDEPHYAAKSGRFLTGKRLESFNAFWSAFAFPRGKAEAADAWLNIPALTEALVQRICEAARQEAQGRDTLLARGSTPKWAQGWLNGRRWEDYEPPKTGQPGMPTAPVVPETMPDEEEWQKAQATRRRLEAERQRKRSQPVSGGLVSTVLDDMRLECAKTG